MSTRRVDKDLPADIDLCVHMCNPRHMATDLRLDEALIAEAQRCGNHPTKQAAIEDALREYVQRRKQLEIIQLFGKIDYDDSYDYQSARHRP